MFEVLSSKNTIGKKRFEIVALRIALPYVKHIIFTSAKSSYTRRQLFVINSPTALAGAIIGLLLVFYLFLQEFVTTI